MLHGLDLFSGIGGLTLALNQWVCPVAYCELDAYDRGTLVSRMADGSLPVAPIWDDVRTLSWRRGYPHVDIVYGGFPCQDISVAGLGAGLDGKRSGLFSEMLRLIGEARPTFVFLENVPAIRTRGAERVVKELAALGYDCRWDVLSAYDVGAPHLRERWFLLACRTSTYTLCQRLRDRWKRRAQGYAETSLVTPDHGATWAMADAYCRRRKEQRLAEPGGQQGARGSAADGCGATRQQQHATLHAGWETEPDVGRVVDGVPKRVDRLRALGNAVVPAQAREAFSRLMGISP